MFVVKHFDTAGHIHVSTCDAYEVDTTVTPHAVELTRYGREGASAVKRDLILEPGESAYIETLLGKCVTGIRYRVD